MRDLPFEKLDVEFRYDFLNIDQNVAISAEGVIFKVGDVVCHGGSPIDGETATISKFTINHDSIDVIAHTERGEGRICFLYHPESV